MTVTLFSENSVSYGGVPAVRAEISKRIYEPCSRASVTVPVSGDVYNVLRIAVADSGGNTVFEGAADDVSFFMNGSGRYAEIKARSLGALLEDNEAIPGTIPAYSSLRNYYSSRIEPYGITCNFDMDPITGQPVTIYKGTSEWTAFGIFMWALRSFIPDINEQNQLVFCPEPSDTVHLFSNTEAGGVPFSEVRFRNRPEKRYSSVWAYSDASAAYEEMAADSAALNEHGKHRMLLSLPNYSAAAKQHRCVMELKKCRAGTRCYTVRLPGSVQIRTWDKAGISDSRFGQASGLVVASVKTVLDSAGEYTEAELWPEGDMVC